MPMNWVDNPRIEGEYGHAVTGQHCIDQAAMWRQRHADRPIRILVELREEADMDSIKPGEFIEAKFLRIYIEGWDPDKEKYRCMEDIPPSIWP